MQRVPPARSEPVSAPPLPASQPKFRQVAAFLEVLAACGRRTPHQPEGREARTAMPPSEEPPQTDGARMPVAERDAPGEGGAEQGQEDDRGQAPTLEPPTEIAVDPLSRALAHAGPRVPPAAEPLPHNVVPPELEQLLTRLVRRAAWGGDGRKGSARLELGAGPLEGATLLVHAEAGELTIDLELPPGASADEWRSRLAARLEARGLSVRELNVR